MTFSSTIHHTIVACFSAYLNYNSCQNELGLPYPSEKGGSFTSSGKHFGWFRSDVCMMEANKGYAYNLLISIAYMTVDYIILDRWIEKKSIINKQTLLHHVMAISGFGMALISGYGMAGISNASLLCEFSSLFMCWKDMFTRETRNSFWGIVVQIGFFITFTMFRFILFPFFGYRTVTTIILAWNMIGWFRRFCMIFCVI